MRDNLTTEMEQFRQLFRKRARTMLISAIASCLIIILVASVLFYDTLKNLEDSNKILADKMDETNRILDEKADQILKSFEPK